jgi:hypothetical protein
MSAELLRKLQTLEADYPGQPRVAQKADLIEINVLRTQLKLPIVDAQLKELGAAPVVEVKKPEPKQEPDHTEAREIYQAYLQKKAELEPHQKYADEVARATSGPGQTPVRPLATMGTNGGPLLCDHCGKPIVLEGGDYHNVTADVAWRRNPVEGWRSWILGGMVVEIQQNGTLRIYHGYPNQPGHCCTLGRQVDTKQRAEWESRIRLEKRDRILAFLRHEFPGQTPMEHARLLGDILDVMYSFDPGIGCNRPNGNEPCTA